MFTFPIEFIPYLPLVLVLWLLIDIYFGYKKGLILQLVDLVSTFVSLFAAWVLSPIFVNIYSIVDFDSTSLLSIEHLIGNHTNRLIWIVILFIAIRIVLLVVKPLASFISKMPLIKQVNSSVGGVFSVIYFLIKLVILVVVLSTPYIKNGSDIIEQTPLKYVDQISEPLLNSVSNFIGRNEALQAIVYEQKLSDEQAKSLQNWLEDKGFTASQIEEFMNKYE